jgi:transcriptional regulator with XRE-family HTH domain
MARAGLDWSQRDLAEAAGVSWRTILRFEAGESVLPIRVQKMRTAIEAKGILFIDTGPLSGGVVPNSPSRADAAWGPNA